jgi:phosphate transport system substrate-binding protein
MAAAIEKAYTHSGVPVATTDQENADLALRTAGSFTVMTLVQMRAERLDLRALPLDGVVATAETLANGAYPFSVRICVVLPSQATPVAAKFAAHLQSASGHALIRSFGATPSP